MKFIRPNNILDANLVSSNVPETDYAAWNAATAYTLGQRCIRTSTHRIYERLVAGTTATAPESDPTNWLDIGPTNRWAMFDQKMGTVTTQVDSISVTLAPGRINSLAILGADASTVAVTLVVDSETVYTATLDLDSGTQVGDWYEYFYEPIYQQTEVVITDLLDASLLDIPAYSNGELTVTLTRTGGTVSCAALVVGLLFEVGVTEWKPQVSIRDFSRKEADEFGNYTLVKRGFSKKMNATVVVKSARADEVTKSVARYRATNLVWIGSSLYGCLVVFGFVTDWRLVIEGVVESKFDVEIEGMTE